MTKSLLHIFRLHLNLYRIISKGQETKELHIETCSVFASQVAEWHIIERPHMLEISRAFCFTMNQGNQSSKVE